MSSPDITPFSYGILALTNPHEWPNAGECNEFRHLLTSKSVYVWPLIFAAYTWHLEGKRGVEFNTELRRVDEYISRHFSSFVEENPVDFSNAGSQYVRAKPGSFQALRRDFGAPVKKLQIPDAERALSQELHNLELRNLIVDPFSVTIAGVALAVLGAVPVSFTKRTKEGDEKYLQVKALLWEFEKLSKEEQTEIRFHFFMEKAIEMLKKHVRLLVAD